ncbi:hypothetical protein M9458_035669, partial [Cirrhinus mrigala]
SSALITSVVCCARVTRVTASTESDTGSTCTRTASVSGSDTCDVLRSDAHDHNLSLSVCGPDVDECEESNSSICEHVFRCRCNAGFTLTSDQRSCAPVRNR